MNHLSLLLGAEPTTLKRGFRYAGPENHRDDFIKHYDAKISPHVSSFEDNRLVALEKLKKNFRLAFVAAVILGFAGIYIALNFLTGDGRLIALFFAVILSGIIFRWAAKPARQYSAEMKNIIFPEVISFFGDEFSFSKNSPWSVESLAPFDILPSFDKTKTEDFIKGRYQGVDIRLMEAELINVSHDSKGRRRESTVFDGVLVQLSMNKAFRSHTIVKRDKGSIGNWFGKKTSSLEQVALEDPIFEKYFQVYSNDQIEARYLLTTSFMERLLSLDKLFGGKAIQCSFLGNSLFLTIKSKLDRFEPGSIYEPAIFDASINNLMNEMEEVFQIVEVLKLNQKIGL